MAPLQPTKDQFTLVSKTIGMLAADAVEKAKSGHPGMPMGMADLAAVLWLKYLRFNPKDPKWLNRDRFVLSNGHGSMLQYALLHLAGFDVTLEDLKNFRQWESKTPGHPESFMTPGIECTTGPLGQGIANSVGMALGERLLAARYNVKDSSIVDHKVFCFLGDGCMMEGVSGEASSVAGHLGLNNLIAIYDDNKISIAGHTHLAFSEDVGKRYEAYGWFVQRINGHDYDAIDAALERAMGEATRPSLIMAATVIGKGSPNKANTHDVHGSALGPEEMKLTKENIGWPLEPTFYIPEEVKAIFSDRVKALKAEYDGWQKLFLSWRTKNSDLAQQLDRQVAREVPVDLLAKLKSAIPQPEKPAATRSLSGAVIQKASAEVNSLIGGSADLEPSTLTLIKGSTDVEKNAFSGLNLRFGVREHGMGSIMNGLSYYGGFIPYGSTFLTFSDYMRPAIRLASLSHIPGLFIFTHDSIFLGEDGPTHQPIEHVNSLRMIPNLWVMRPADGLETAACYALALSRRDGPCALIFTRQNLDPIARPNSFKESDLNNGAYTAYESAAGKSPELVFIATGSEVSLAIAAAKQLPNVTSRVVSMPCQELFEKSPAVYQSNLIPAAAKKVIVEAGTTFGWRSMIPGSSEDTLVIGIDRYGASAPQKVLAEKFGLTPEAVTAKIKAHFKLA